MVNSRQGLVTATASGFLRKGSTPYARHPFSRSYGVNLPSSLAGSHPCALGFSPRLPVSVYGTVTHALRATRLFLAVWSRLVQFGPKAAPPREPDGWTRSPSARICLGTPLHPRPYHVRRYGQPILLRPPLARARGWGGNVDPLPFAYAFRPRLRGRLTLGGLTFPRKPWAYGEVGFHHLYRYSCRQSHFPAVQHPLRDTFSQLGTLPYRCE